MNKVYIYDGSFSSLISLILFLIKNNQKPKDIKSKNEYVPNLLDTPISLNLENKSIYLFKKKMNKISKISYYVYLSSNEYKELILYYFIKNSLKYGNEVFFHKNLNCVNKTIKLSTSVSREAHHMKGFLRFKKMKNNFYYAEISPTNNILEIISNHFKKRLSNEYWIIKDVNRNIYAVYDLKKITYLPLEDILKLNLDFSSDEKEIEDLWKAFFETIAIKERKNLRCQRNFMPKKYWKQIIEMEDKI